MSQTMRFRIRIREILLVPVRHRLLRQVSALSDPSLQRVRERLFDHPLDDTLNLYRSLVLAQLYSQDSVFDLLLVGDAAG